VEDDMKRKQNCTGVLF